MDDLGSTFFLLFVMIAVIAAAYFVTKFISKKSMKLVKNRYINVCDRMNVSKDKQVVLIEVGGTYFLIGCSNNSMDTISTFEGEAFSDLENQKKAASGKGVFKGVVDFVSNAKKAQTELYNQRMQNKQKPKLQDDVLEKIIRNSDMANKRIRDKNSKNSGRSL